MFIPYVSYPVTEFATVYTTLHTFQSVLRQLNQESLPLFCDEGVFRIIAEITLQRPEEFKNIVPMMGSFHFAKAGEHRLGELLKVTGFQDALEELSIWSIRKKYLE